MSCSMSGEEADCPLCLMPLESHDRSHPIQCPSRHCRFDCCADCLERMIKAAREDDGSSVASDGNAFRVFLHCPNCRSNLGPSIRDTVLLRKVDEYRALHRRYTPDGVEVIDERLSASELRFKYALEKDEDVTSAVDLAQQREDEFFGRGVGQGDVEVEANESFGDYLGGGAHALGRSISNGVSSWFPSTNSTAGSVWSFDDEEGFEADLHGPHKSFIFRHRSFEDPDIVEAGGLRRLEDVRSDSTLLRGLDAFMTPQEQQFMTAQMISGETARLAAATEMMHYVSALSREGIRPSLKRQQSLVRTKSQSAKRSILESIKEVIREGNEAQRLEEEREAANNGLALHHHVVVSSRLHASAQRHVTLGLASHGKRHQKMQADMEMKREMEYMALHPLPLRMPKYAEAAAAYRFGVTFADDTWDGTVLDAYSKITVSTSLLGRVTVSKRHADSDGVHRVVGTRHGSGRRSPSSPLKSSPSSSRSMGRLPRPGSPQGFPPPPPPRSPRSVAGCAAEAATTSRPRVIVSSINREMGRQGVVAGDVVTHFNGEEFAGSAHDLAEMIGDRCEGEVLTFVFNADAAVAEALKRRSMISEASQSKARRSLRRPGLASRSVTV